MLQYGTPMYYDASGTEYAGSYGDGSGTSSGTGTTQYPSSSVTGEPEYPTGGGGTGSGSSSVVQYPIDQFLKAQGTFCASDGMGGCVSYMQPTANYLGWFNRANTMSAAVDYAGIANTWLMSNGKWLGTDIRGTVTESALGDGRSRVVVQINGDNVHAYVTEGAGFEGSTVIGYTPAESWDRPADPVLGHLDMEIVYINPYMGAPMPDLVELIQAPKGQQIESIRMRYEGVGRLRSTGERKIVRVEYDPSFGPIYPSHPASPEQTTAMGGGRVQIVY